MTTNQRGMEIRKRVQKTISANPGQTLMTSSWPEALIIIKIAAPQARVMRKHLNVFENPATPFARGFVLPPDLDFTLMCRRNVVHTGQEEIGKTVSAEMRKEWARQMAEREMTADSRQVEQAINRRLASVEISDSRTIEKMRENIKDNIRDCLVKEALDSATDKYKDKLPPELREKLQSCLK